MIARVGLVGLLLVTAVLLQTAVFPWLTLLGFRPDLLLLVVIAIAIHDGPLAGARVGAAAGLLGDLLVAQAPAGLFLLVYVVLGYGVGIVRPYLAPESLTAPVLAAFASGVLATAGYGVAASLLTEVTVSLALVLQASLAVGLYNALLSPGVDLVVRRLVAEHPLRGAASAE